MSQCGFLDARNRLSGRNIMASQRHRNVKVEQNKWFVIKQHPVKRVLWLGGKWVVEL